MELFKNIRLRVGRSVLSSRASSIRRLKQDFDFNKVSRIGIIWDSTNEDDIKHIASFNRQMTEKGKTVEVLTWIPGKAVSDRLTGLSYMRFMKKSDLSWTFIPSSQDAEKFTTTKYDLLIDINPSSIFPMTYISTVSPSPMKVGPDISGDTEKLPYDLMIQAGHPFNTALFLEQVLIYLAMISNGTRA